MSRNPEWERLWQIVRTTPEDFDSWEQLISIAESVEITPATPEHIANLEHVYDHFLTKFPLCFGYWKKYADWEEKLRGYQGAEKTFEKGLAAIHNSVDLWNQYITFKMNNSTNNQEIENLFERASTCIGYDFLAHPFWDKYIEFIENTLADMQKLLHLMDRIVVIPMHQYARYYEKWRGLRADKKVSEAVMDTVLKGFYAEIQTEKGELPKYEALEVALREKLDVQTVNVYKETQEGTNKRWVYESEIKRSYFHVKPLDRPQLQNWNKYLNFEEAVNDKIRIRALYERCLVPCAQYEEFWLRYGQWLIKNDFITEAQSAYTKAAYTFLRGDKIRIKLALALLFEEEKKINEARSTYTSILEASPSHIESVINYIHFERRQSPETFESIINQYINSEYFDKPTRLHFTIQYIKHLQQIKQEEKARSIYKEYSNIFETIKQFWINYINFELGFYDDEANTRIIKVFENARKSLTTVEAQKIINNRYREFLLERGNNVYLLNRTQLNQSTDFLSEKERTLPLKRPIEVEEAPFTKQTRYDTYYGQQQQPSNYMGNYYKKQ